DDEAGPGQWISSNTGVLGRPLVDGSWDGWAYRAFGESGPALAVNAPAAIPEPGSLLLFASASLTLFLRKRVA
ncbi:MAG: PEP-CTERM sorting domain-containing protein, partial [Luteolibacter sp.]